ncbi:hypothetical protein J6590_038763 [Homalodisca vitripennis]|nr:hypothetical protein J6590_038763 [Homalodisca vitripennis]
MQERLKYWSSVLEQTNVAGRGAPTAKTPNKFSLPHLLCLLHFQAEEIYAALINRCDPPTIVHSISGSARELCHLFFSIALFPPTRNLHLTNRRCLAEKKPTLPEETPFCRLLH